jgi:hypothetical protein
MAKKKIRPRLQILIQGMLFDVQFKDLTEHHEFCESVHEKLGDRYVLTLADTKNVIWLRASDVSALIS